MISILDLENVMYMVNLTGRSDHEKLASAS